MTAPVKENGTVATAFKADASSRQRGMQTTAQQTAWIRIPLDWEIPKHAPPIFTHAQLEQVYNFLQQYPPAKQEETARSVAKGREKFIDNLDHLQQHVANYLKERPLPRGRVVLDDEGVGSSTDAAAELQDPQDGDGGAEYGLNGPTQMKETCRMVADERETGIATYSKTPPSTSERDLRDDDTGVGPPMDAADDGDEVSEWYCHICSMDLNGPTQMEDHKNGKKHKANVRKTNSGTAASKGDAIKKVIKDPDQSTQERGDGGRAQQGDGDQQHMQQWMMGSQHAYQQQWDGYSQPWDSTYAQPCYPYPQQQSYAGEPPSDPPPEGLTEVPEPPPPPAGEVYQ